MNWQKVAGAGLGVMAAVSVWKEFGPRTYLVTTAGSGQKGHVILYTLTNPALIRKDIVKEIKKIGNDRMVITSITRV